MSTIQEQIFQRSCGTPEEKPARLCHSACIWAGVQFCGIRDGLCYFEVWYDSDDDDWDDSDDFDSDNDRPHAVLSIPIPAESPTGKAAFEHMIEQMINQIGAEIERNTQ